MVFAVFVLLLISLFVAPIIYLMSKERHATNQQAEDFNRFMKFQIEKSKMNKELLEGMERSSEANNRIREMERSLADFK